MPVARVTPRPARLAQYPLTGRADRLARETTMTEKTTARPERIEDGALDSVSGGLVAKAITKNEVIDKSVASPAVSGALKQVGGSAAADGSV